MLNKFLFYRSVYRRVSASSLVEGDLISIRSSPNWPPVWRQHTAAKSTDEHSVVLWVHSVAIVHSVVS